MTQHHDDAFTPDTVDERIDQLASLSPQEPSSPSGQVVQRLHALYEDDQRSTERVWQRLIQHVDVQQESDSVAEYRQPGSLNGTWEGKVFMQQGTLARGKRGPTRLTLVAAILFATLLVSSLLWVLHISYPTLTALPAKSTPVALPVPASPPGLYFTKPGEISRLDEQTRKVIWRASVPPIKNVMDRVASTPVVIGDAVYLIKGNTVFAFDANKGTLRWSSVFGTGVVNIFTADGLLYVNLLFPSNDNSKLYVVDPVNGKIKATYISPLGAWNNPTVVNSVAYVTWNSRLYALSLSSKKQLWHQQVDADQGLDQIAVKNGTVYVSSMIGASDKRKNSAGLLYAFDAKTGKRLWQSSEMPVGVRTFLVSDDDIVYCASIGDFDVFDGHTGKHLWHQHDDVSDMLLNAGVLYINDSTMSKGPGIVALRARDGKKIWGITSDAGNSAFPFLGLQRGIIYTIADDGKVGSIDALRAGDGSRVWHLSIKGDATKFGATVA